MKRRDFIALIGGAAAAWPMAARAQQGEQMRRIGVFFAGLERGDPEVTARVAAFQQALAGLGWIDGGNVRIDYRWGGGDADLRHKYAAELIALGPDTILAVGSPSIAPLLQAPGPFQSCS